MIAAVLGATYLGNTYQASSSVSNVLFELIAAGALSAVLVPTFVDLFRAGDDAEAERLASGVLGLALAIMAVVSVVGRRASPTPIARLLSSGAPNAQVESQQVELSAFFLRFFVPQVLLYAVGTVATAVLFAKRRFVIVAVAPIANTVILVATMAIFRIMHGPNPSLDLTTAGEARARDRRHARRRRLRRGADDRAAALAGSVCARRSARSTASCAGCSGSRRGSRCNPTSRCCSAPRW